MKAIREEYYKLWKEAYEALNDAQKEAVNQTEGAIMAIAGPGTGKTQLLAIRIGKILLETQADPQNILCLTYTDAGAIAMRQRLARYIGPEAYNVNIHTFHAFCNAVIRDNNTYFGSFRDLQLLSEIEEIEVYRTLLDSLPQDHPIKRLKGNTYYEADRLKSLFSLMKQEGWTPGYMQQQFAAYATLLNDPATTPDDYIYRKKYTDKEGVTHQAGELKTKTIAQELAKYEQMISASELIHQYNQLLAEQQRFDYQDMILWVIEKFKQHDALLARYQERFQYLLVDEYQDTNGAQNTLLFQLAAYWEDPNVFIVGDDDQSIFRFQGANMESILEFKERFHPREIVLTDNYRSSQVILDTSKKLIENNQERLVNKYTHLVKNLLEKRTPTMESPPRPLLMSFASESQEEAWVMHQVSELKARGEDPGEIAIIYTKHRVVENMVRYCTQKGIPVNVRKRVNVLNETEVLQLTTILSYLQQEYSRPHSGEDRLFDILHFSCFGLSPLDIAAVTILCRRRSENENDEFLYWRPVLADAGMLSRAGVRNVQDIMRIASLLENWIAAISNCTIQILIEKILSESNMLTQILQSSDKAWKLQLVNTFFDFVKNEAAKSGELSLGRLMVVLDLMKENKLELPVSRILTNEKGIHFLTAHSAKGLEFKHVFIIRTNSTLWEKKTNNQHVFPILPTLQSSIHAGSIEDDRRLMYVAMTRAKDHLYITWPAVSDDEKVLEPSRFITEITHLQDSIEMKVPEHIVLEYKAEVLRFRQGEPTFIDADLLKQLLTDFKMSATSLNKFLKCRLSFYFENVLRVPMGRNATMGFGNAIHHALQYFFQDFEASEPRSMPSVSRLVTYFEQGMAKYRSHFTALEFENHMTLGQRILNEYFEKYHTDWWAARKFHPELSIPLVHYQGIPISGKLDRLDEYDGFVSVTDYKTGKYDTKKLSKVSDDNDLGGDYWRQMIFYRMLLDGYQNHRYTMKKGIMDFVEKGKDGKFRKTAFDITLEEIEIVGQQLKDAYEAIHRHEFLPGCGEESCQWCQFVNRNMPVSIEVETEE